MNTSKILALRGMFSRRSTAWLAIVAVALVGCASPASHEAMTATAVAVPHKSDKSVSVTVGGGKDTNPAWKSEISDSAFQQAIVDSITKSGLFKNVTDNGADYQLSVVIVNMDQPSFGLKFTVKMEAGWTLKRASTGEVVWQEVIKSEHTSTPSDAFAAVKRLRLANEGAAQANIEAGLEKIAQLSL